MNLPLLTSSRAKAARACLRLHKLRYLDGYRPAQESDVLRFGTLVHKGLEVWWRWYAQPTPDATALQLALRAIDEAESDPFERAKAGVMLVGYDTRWASARLEVLAVEQEFSAPLVNPLTHALSKTWRLAGKVDAIARDLDTGLVYVVEHKTSSEDIGPGSDYWRRLRMDGQVSVYFAGARSMGHDVAGCLYDVLGKPGIVPLKATPLESRKYTKTGALYAAQRDRDETPDEYRLRLVEKLSEDADKFFQRGTVSRLDGELEDALTDVWQLGQQLREAERLGRAPRNPDACVRWGRTCEFFDVCTGAASLDDPSRFKRDANVHPELSGAAPELAGAAVEAA